LDGHVHIKNAGEKRPDLTCAEQI